MFHINYTRQSKTSLRLITNLKEWILYLYLENLKKKNLLLRIRLLISVYLDIL